MPAPVPPTATSLASRAPEQARCSGRQLAVDVPCARSDCSDRPRCLEPPSGPALNAHRTGVDSRQRIGQPAGVSLAGPSRETRHDGDPRWRRPRTGGSASGERGDAGHGTWSGCPVLPVPWWCPDTADRDRMNTAAVRRRSQRLRCTPSPPVARPFSDCGLQVRRGESRRPAPMTA